MNVSNVSGAPAIKYETAFEISLIVAIFPEVGIIRSDVHFGVTPSNVINWPDTPAVSIFIVGITFPDKS